MLIAHQTRADTNLAFFQEQFTKEIPILFIIESPTVSSFKNAIATHFSK